ncbi:MAG TPA: hypothetical protein VGM69_24305 [Chloroflexota bacterium]
MRLLQLLLVLTLLAPQVADAGDERFGLGFVSPTDRVADGRRLDQAAQLGAGWDRFPLYWSQVQPTPDGQLDFSKSDAVIAADLSRGIKVQVILVGAPDWATAGGKVDTDAWARFVGATVRTYRGRVSHWEMWNEPDLLDNEGKGRFWPWGIPEYARLLKAGYFAAREADPSATVLMAGLSMPYNNERFFDQLLEELARDPDAPRNGWYFDVLPVHVYDRAARVYELPHGYVGYPSFAGFHALMKRRGFDKPIWVNELGVPVWDYGTGQKAPGRATQDEQAAFVLQAFAYGLAAGNDRHFFFQLYDDGAGAVDSQRGPAEYFGLIANDGAPRPAYQTYRTALDLFAGARLATRVNSGRTADKKKDPKGIEMISLWGTARGRVTVAWNAEGGGPVEARVPAIAPTAQLLDKLGRVTGSVSAQNGAFTVSLPGATNNNNFDCFTPRGCDTEDYVIGGDPVVIVESDPRVPPVTIERLPSASAVPFRVAWRPTESPAAATFDVDYVDLTEDPSGAAWRRWLTATRDVSASFGAEMPIARDHTYAFRVRASGGAWPTAPLASTFVYGGGTWPPPKPEVDARIEIVWPQGNAPVERADKANVLVNVFRAGTLTSVGPSWSAPPRLWRSVDNGVEEPVGLGRARTVEQNGLKYPVWEVNDVDVAAARDPKKKIYFRLSMDGKRESTNVWAHAADARTFLPQPDVPTGVLAAMPPAVDARIEIVWPHGNAPVDRAEKVNVVAYLLEHDGRRSVPSAFNGQVVLHRSLNNGPDQAVALGDQEMRTVGGVTFPVWVFNDVDVAAARDRKNKYYFRLEVGGGVPFFSNLWAHAADARTFVPQPDTPTAVAP